MRVDVDESLRGWRWDEPPVQPPPLGVRLAVSDVANRYCDSGRDLYLRRVLRVEASPSDAMRFGRFVHDVLRLSLREARRLIIDGVDSGDELLNGFDAARVVEEAAAGAGWVFDERGVRLARYVAVQVAAELDRVLARGSFVDREALAHRVAPMILEYPVDGSVLGLTQLFVDAVAFDIPIEVKVGHSIDSHELALAGYALAMEAEFEVPVNHGLLIYVHVNSRVRLRVRHVAIGDSLRRRFLEARDELMELVASGRDPGRSGRCPASCPFLQVCGDLDGSRRAGSHG